MPATMIIQLVTALVGQLPEIVKIIEELHASGAQTLTPDQTTRAQAACSAIQPTMDAMWPAAKP